MGVSMKLNSMSVCCTAEGATLNGDQEGGDFGSGPSDRSICTDRYIIGNSKVLFYENISSNAYCVTCGALRFLISTI